MAAAGAAGAELVLSAYNSSSSGGGGSGVLSDHVLPFAGTPVRSSGSTLEYQQTQPVSQPVIHSRVGTVVRKIATRECRATGPASAVCR